MSLTTVVWSLPVVNSLCEMVNRMLYITADETENDDYITCTCKCITPTSELKGIHVKVTALGVLCCFALFVCLTLLASFFLPSHLSFKNMYITSK